jgi:hypothetical protein
LRPSTTISGGPRKGQRLRRGPIEPLRIINDAEQGLLLGHRRREAQRRQPNQEPIGRLTGTPTERNIKRITLRSRQLLEPIEHRVAELLKARERELHLPLDAGRPLDPEPRRRLDQEFQKRGFADPRACNAGTSNGYVCNPRLDQRMQRADALQLSDPRRAAELWTRIDHEIVNNAYWLTTVNGHEPELVSKRLKNYQYSPVGDFIADQVWLR